MNISQKILIIASPNVQENFKLQLFDESKLKQNNGIWNLEGCTSNKLLKEINPTSIKGLTKEKIVSLIKNIIKTYYYFMGYTKFSLMIDKAIGIALYLPTSGLTCPAVSFPSSTNLRTSSGSERSLRVLLI